MLGLVGSIWLRAGAWHRSACTELSIALRALPYEADLTSAFLFESSTSAMRDRWRLSSASSAGTPAPLRRPHTARLRSGHGRRHRSQRASRTLRARVRCRRGRSRGWTARAVAPRLAADPLQVSGTGRAGCVACSMGIAQVRADADPRAPRCLTSRHPRLGLGRCGRDRGTRGSRGDRAARFRPLPAPRHRGRRPLPDGSGGGAGHTRDRRARRAGSRLRAARLHAKPRRRRGGA